MLIEQVITERFINLIGDDPKKQQYMHAVWDMLQKSYQNIGGLKIGGLDSAQDLVKLPMWKIMTKDGEIKLVVLYKDKGGRKSVAVATDGSREAVRQMSDVMKHEAKRAYSEKSKASLGMFMKSVSNPEQYLIPIDQVKDIVGQDAQIISIANKDPAEWPVDSEELESAQRILKKYPKLQDYGYLRMIRNNYKFKVMTGTPDLPIK